MDRLRGAPPLVGGLEDTELAGDLEAGQVATLDLPADRCVAEPRQLRDLLRREHPLSKHAAIRGRGSSSGVTEGVADRRPDTGVRARDAKWKLGHDPRPPCVWRWSVTAGWVNPR